MGIIACMIFYPYLIRILAKMAAYCSFGTLPYMGVRSLFGKLTGFPSLSRIMLIFASSTNSGNIFEYSLLSLSSQGKSATRVCSALGRSVCIIRRASRFGLLLDYGLGGRQLVFLCLFSSCMSRGSSRRAILFVFRSPWKIPHTNIV